MIIVTNNETGWKASLKRSSGKRPESALSRPSNASAKKLYRPLGCLRLGLPKITFSQERHTDSGIRSYSCCRRREFWLKERCRSKVSSLLHEKLSVGRVVRVAASAR